MSLRDDAKMLADKYKHHTDYLGINNQLFNIYEGDLLTYILEDLKADLSPQSFAQMKTRISPINVLKRLVDKLSKIYAKAPKRNIEDGADKDAELVTFYSDEMSVNTYMSMANEFFNLFKTVAIEPFLDQGKPRLRIIPADRFFVHSTDIVNPMRPTHFVKIMGKMHSTQTGKTSTVLYLYTDTEFLIVDDEGNVLQDAMERAGIPDGVNPYGVIPIVYVNRSRHDLIPKQDTDTLTMTKLLPILISDLNFAVKFQAFSIMYGIDVDEEGLKMSPNAFWRLKSDPSNPNGKPQLGTIKPEVNIDQVLGFISAQLAFWLNSRNIRPGTMSARGGTVNTENFSSGISKAIDEMDTSEDRQKQVPYFIEAEAALWDLIINRLHPIWMRDNRFEMPVAFSKSVDVRTEFAEQRPMIDPTAVITNGVLKLTNALATRKMVLQEIYPDSTPEQIDEMLVQIDTERVAMLTANVPDAVPTDNADGDMDAQPDLNPKDKASDTSTVGTGTPLAPPIIGPVHPNGY